NTINVIIPVVAAVVLLGLIGLVGLVGLIGFIIYKKMKNGFFSGLKPPVSKYLKYFIIFISSLCHFVMFPVVFV
ncbi:hypothetical protein AMECASPLE_039548, partial [Ameca splendens]